MPDDSKQLPAVLTPKEFAVLFGRSQTWTYRLLYAGKLRTIPGIGRISIPSSEVDRLLATACVYEGKESKSPEPRKRSSKRKK